MVTYTVELVKSESGLKIQVEVLNWEQFDRGVGNKAVAEITKGKGAFLVQDMILVPCNPHSLHWHFLVAYPSEKCILVLDSQCEDFIKPAAFQSVKKMSFLVEDDNTIGVSQWKFHSSTPKEIPQQHNDLDCGVFVCLYFKMLGQW